MSEAFPTGAPIWPFDVDWSAAYRITYSFKTTVSTTRSGLEQRRALRAAPRKTVQFTTVFNAPAMNRFRRLMAARQSLPLIFPEVTRSMRVDSVAAGIVTLSSTAAWLQPGVRVLLIAGDRREIFTISSVMGAAVSLPGVVADWTARTTLYPALAGYLRSPAITLPTNGVGQGSITVDVIPGSGTIDEAEGAAESFDGRPLFTAKPNWADGATETFVWPRTALDYGRGRVAVTHPIEFGTRSRAATFVQRSRDDADALLAFFLSQRGRRGEFYAPTAYEDLALAAPVSAGDTAITVGGADISAAFDGELVHRAIQITLRDGTIIRRTVIDISASVLHLGAAVGVAFTAADVRQICWLPIWRFASDDLVVEWLTDSIAQTQITMSTLPNLDYLDEGVLRSIPEGDGRSIAGTGDDRGVAG